MVSFRGNNEQLCNALRHCADRKSTRVTDRAVLSEAADRLEALEAENARLRRALETISKQKTTKELHAIGDCDGDYEYAYDRIIGVARAALKQEGGE